MQIMDFAKVVHRVSNRVRLSVPSRRGDTVYFTRLEEAFLRSGEILSARANPLAGSIVIRHAPMFTLSATSLARFDLVCAVPLGPYGQTGPQWGAADVGRCRLALQIVATALGQPSALQLCGLLAELCLKVVLHSVARPQTGSPLLFAS
jgi:hypothetical protein